MLTELCQELKNWFDREKYFGDFTIESGELVTALPLVEGQYFRIIGSLFNDGVHQYGSSSHLIDESFSGAIWSMAVPPTVIDLAAEIKAWQDKYGGVDSAAMSPYASESFGGYSYSKSGGGAGSSANAGAGTWQGAFASRLNMWRKI